MFKITPSPLVVIDSSEVTKDDFLRLHFGPENQPVYLCMSSGNHPQLELDKEFLPPEVVELAELATREFPWGTVTYPKDREVIEAAYVARPNKSHDLRGWLSSKFLQNTSVFAPERQEINVGRLLIIRLDNRIEFSHDGHSVGVNLSHPYQATSACPVVSIRPVTRFDAAIEWSRRD